MRTLATVIVSAVLALVLWAAPAGAQSPQYLTIGNAYKAGAPIGCADVNWAAQQGLIEPVEVRWLNELGIQCPDGTVAREGVPSNQYVVMLAMAAKGQLTCADVEWNAAHGFLTWSGAINLAGGVPGCAISPYANMVALAASGRLSCADVEWNLANGTIDPNQAGWINGSLARSGRSCAPPFGPGLKLVNVDIIAPGRYIARDTVNCYWERVSRLDGSFSAIIANAFTSGQVIVDIAASDVGFEAGDGCGTWSPYNPSGELRTFFGPGSWVVGDQIAPGRYRSDTPGNACYWERIRGFGNRLEEVIANNFTSSPTVVDVLSGDVGFSSSGCGGWNRIG